MMKRYLMTNAGWKGYETMDVQPVFTAHYRQYYQRFERTHDYWYVLGHERSVEAVVRSELLSGKFPRRKQKHVRHLWDC